ncbi:deleted in azoospermia-like isoform X2 [Notolabrus celidotus]|uniref:deleted in azoospermia-like isoform X2 n=1 Tax=Notolabrus celidotus TaxID=1203425 RepID=UPI0014906589|nr:deleted in azoospermia-like isoform X2 [Notolabrus celidotus]XP_034561305.1 deleted in azoospermia-like isoform X2 [Notolabrus celidotus]XP_034561306.1 deleted in azoospermia-like isoform X2 [Notolabrus celidotus]XP_034561307.1 deleted in azoospermia-like isoform X2 [Notolabrus celidotus]
MSPSLQMSNGFILPEGKLTPHALFVGGINMKVHVNELQNFFARYGSVKEVKIITYRGISKGYGFVYFDDDVNIQSIIEQTIVFDGRELKLGPAIMKERSSRSMPSRMICPAPWRISIQSLYCVCCSPGGACVAQPLPILNGESPYNQPYLYSKSNSGGVMVPQMPMNFAQNAYAYQNCADYGVQTRLNVL